MQRFLRKNNSPHLRTPVNRQLRLSLELILILLALVLVARLQEGRRNRSAENILGDVEVIADGGENSVEVQ